MKPILSTRNVTSQIVDFVARHCHKALRDAQNVNLCLSTLCRPESLSEIRFPVAYVEFLRACIEYSRCAVKEVKRESRSDYNGERFTTLLEVLRSSLPPIEFSVATSIALVADHYRTLRQPLEPAWAADICHHFQAASSFGKTGRILSTIVRFTRSKRCLEAGTAYGMSALFTLEAIRNNLGNTQDELPKLAKTAGPCDFMFHDDGHSGETYIRDFNAVKDAFSPGAVVLFDDIRWEDLSMTEG